MKTTYLKLIGTYYATTTTTKESKKNPYKKEASSSVENMKRFTWWLKKEGLNEYIYRSIKQTRSTIPVCHCTNVKSKENPLTWNRTEEKQHATVQLVFVLFVGSFFPVRLRHPLFFLFFSFEPCSLPKRYLGCCFSSAQRLFLFRAWRPRLGRRQRNP